MKTWKILTLAIALVSIGAPRVAGFTTWLSPVVRAGVLALVAPVALAVALVGYFNWRARLTRRILAADERHDTLLRVA